MTIRKRLTVMILLAVVTVMSIAGLIRISAEIEHSRAAGANKLDMTAELAVDSLVDPLWSFNDHALKSICESFFKDPEIGMIVVTASNGTLVYQKRIPAPEYAAEKLTIAERNIFRQNTLIGKVSIGATNHYRNLELRNEVVNALLGIALVCLFLWPIIALVAEMVTKPIYRLSEGTEEIAGGNFAKRLEGNPYDEVGKLAKKFNFMAEKLQEIMRERELQYDELVRASASLSQSEARFRTVVTNAPIIIYALDQNGIFTLFEGLALRRLHLNPGDFVGDSVFAKFGHSPELLQGLTRAFAGEASFFEHRLGSFYFDNRLVPLLDEFRQVKGVIGTALDVTERVRHEQEARMDAQLATKVQNALLSQPKSSEHLCIATIYHPHNYVGGDLYFIDWRYGGGLLRGFLIDVAGHGMGTALHTASLHVLLREVNELDLPLAEAMRWLNRRVVEYFDEATFAAAVGFEFDLEVRQFRWICAGIPKIWTNAQSARGSVVRQGMFLGLHDEELFELYSYPLACGECFYFMTDGLSDLLERQAEPPFETFDDMVALLGELSASRERRDDATAVCIRVESLPRLSFRLEGWPRILRLKGYGDYQRLRGEINKILAEATGLEHSFSEVAVNEALANAMECRDGVPRQHSARIRFNIVGRRLIVRVKTSRIGFAGNAILRRLKSHPEEMFAFGEDASMGRGIPMMLSMAHHMTYNHDGTEVLLAWRLEARQSGPS